MVAAYAAYNAFMQARKEDKLAEEQPVEQQPAVPDSPRSPSPEQRKGGLQAKIVQGKKLLRLFSKIFNFLEAKKTAQQAAQPDYVMLSDDEGLQTSVFCVCKNF